MFTWSKDNRACDTTWSTLSVLKQSAEDFAGSGTVKVQELAFWNKAASSDTRKIDAHTLAIQMDNAFTKIRGAKYEANITKEKAINDMLVILTNGDKTVADLAEINDSNYLFWKEAK